MESYAPSPEDLRDLAVEYSRSRTIVNMVLRALEGTLQRMPTSEAAKMQPLLDEVAMIAKNTPET